MTYIILCRNCEPGELIQVNLAKNERTEAEWIGRKIQILAQNSQTFAYKRVAVLARNHKRVEVVTGE